MILNHVLGLSLSPRREWQQIASEAPSVPRIMLGHVMLLALIPTICGYIGVTQVGWSVGTGRSILMTEQSALIIAVLGYLAMIAGVVLMGFAINWMGNTFGAETTLSSSVAIAGYGATPLFIAGFALLYPLLWLDMLIVIAAFAYGAYLVYTALPAMTKINQEQSLLMFGSILAVGLVMWVSMQAATAILWGFGLGPIFR